MIKLAACVVLYNPDDTIFENTIKNSDSIKMVEIKNSETNKNENDEFDDQIKLKVKIKKITTNRIQIPINQYYNKEIN